MPPAIPVGTSRLKINLDNGPIFRPGDVISGHVIRKEHIVSPKTRVTITLRGRAKVKITVSRQNSRSHYRGRWNFFDYRSCPDTSLRIFDGPLHIPPFPQATEDDWAVWPFAITIPEHTHMNHHSNHGEEGFIDPHRTDSEGKVILDPLPSSFSKSDSGFSTSFDGYVEYSLEATLSSADTANHTHENAVHPLTIHARPPETPINSHAKLLRRNLFDVVKTQRLEPGMAEAELGFRQNLAKTLKLGSVPAFAFKLEVTTPARVQLEAAEGQTVPFMLRVVPNEKGAAPEMSKKMLEEPPVVALARIRLAIRQRTSVQAQGTLYPHTAGDSEKSDLGTEWLIPRRIAPIELPVGENATALDVGALLGLRFGVWTSEVLGKEVRMSPRLVESFRTYCIEQRHSLIWEVTLTIAQETKKFEGEAGLELVAPALMSQRTEEEVPAGGSRAAYENGLAPPPEENRVEEMKPGEEPPAYEK